MNNKLLPIDFVDSMTNYMMFEKGSSISWRVVKVSDIRAMLSAAPDVAGEAVDYDEDAAKRFRAILSMLGIGAPESDEQMMLCQFSLFGMMRQKIKSLYDKPDRTAELEDKVNRLVEALRKAQPACVIASDFKYDDGDEDAAQEWNMINVSVSTLLAEINETSGFIGGEV